MSDQTPIQFVSPGPIQTALEQASVEPLRARDQAVEVQNRSLTELIEADKYVRKINSASDPFGSLKRRVTRPGRPGGLP